MSRTDEIVTVDAPFPKAAWVRAADGFHIVVGWKGGGETRVDLGPDILAFKVYAPLREDRSFFEAVHVVNESVIAWGVEDEIDMHVSAIERLASERMETIDFQSFLDRLGLTWDAAAAQLGISRRMVGYYAKGQNVPRPIALACAYLEIAQARRLTETAP